MQSPSALRRKDTTKGPPLRILSLDGGGVRGYSMLIILQELMHRTFVETEGRAPKRHEIPKPADHFDLIAGTGTGGLIAMMLGRLRLDVDTCKDVYARMTRKVFETDKTVLGIPLRGTMFKASKLEEAIRECVSQHTIYEDEGNDILSLAEPQGSESGESRRARTMSSASSRYSSIGMSVSSIQPQPRSAVGRGDPDAMLYDQRDNRTKTAVTAMLRVREPQSASTALLRSYDSRKEPAPDVNCTIWEAGRATCATGLAFKPIQIEKSIYHDDGEGTYNPSPQILHEAVVNEWPGREVGVFVSIGTGKRPSDAASPNQQHLWWEGLAGGSIGEFAEARRRLVQKIEGCEDIHQNMIRKHLPGLGIDPGVYFRLNVEIGVGDFKMNEWNRLSEISAGTRVYLQKPQVEIMNQGAATKLAQVHFAKKRQQNAISRGSWDQNSDETYSVPKLAELDRGSSPIAVELPTETSRSPPQGIRYPQGRSSVVAPATTGSSPPIPGKYRVVSADESSLHPPTDSPRTSSSMPLRISQDGKREQMPTQAPPPPPPQQQAQQQNKQASPAPYVTSADDRLTSHAPEPYRPPPGVPPLPPKMPLTDDEDEEDDQANDLHPRPLSISHAPRRITTPYPDADGPPPPVNLARKPQIGRR